MEGVKSRLELFIQVGIGLIRLKLSAYSFFSRILEMVENFEMGRLLKLVGSVPVFFQYWSNCSGLDSRDSSSGNEGKDDIRNKGDQGRWMVWICV